MDVDVDPMDLTAPVFSPVCDHCGESATVIGKGCADKEPVLLCDRCLDRGLEVVRNYIRMYQRFNKRICICGDCYRPILTLDTHLEVRRLKL